MAIVGCGLIGSRRAAVARQAGGAEVRVVADVDDGRAQALAREMGCSATSDWQAAVAREDVAVVVVSTTNNWLAAISIASLARGKHVLVEKPMARNPAEAQAVVRAAAAGSEGGALCRPLVCVGFNHRYHPAIRKAHALWAEGAIGEIAFVRCRYGHGGRPGYGKEWRADPEISGGGELLDQGIHAVDLFRWFLGDFAQASGFTGSYFWTRQDEPPTAGPDAGAAPPVEDNGFALFRTAAGQVATLHTSWTQWKNLFSFEVFGQDGYLVVEGLGGSYGAERLTWGRRRPESGPPDETRFEFGGPDTSWTLEWQGFVDAIQKGESPLASDHDGFQAVRMIHAVYESANKGTVVRL